MLLTCFYFLCKVCCKLLLNQKRKEIGGNTSRKTKRSRVTLKNFYMVIFILTFIQNVDLTETKLFLTSADLNILSSEYFHSQIQR